jgi:hypothetical protein
MRIGPSVITCLKAERSTLLYAETKVRFFPLAPSRFHWGVFENLQFAAITSAKKSFEIHPRSLIASDSFWLWLDCPDAKALRAAHRSVFIERLELILASSL